MKLKKNSDEQPKDTGMAVVLILLLAAHVTGKFVFIYPTILVVVLNMTYPKIFKPLSKVWFGISTFVGTYVSKILLSIIYILLVIPVGFLRKMCGVDSMRKKMWKRNNSSVFVVYDKTYQPEDLENPY
jgi:hypothetical protein